MNEENENTSLMEKYIKLRLGGVTYRIRLLTLLLFAAAAIILIAAILILAFSGSCAKNKANAQTTEPTASTVVSVTAAPTDVPSPTPEAAAPSDTPEAVAPESTPETTAEGGSFKTLKSGADNDGEIVKKVQQRLVDLHYMPYPGDGNTVTTVYKSMCEKAIRCFKERNGIKPVNGECDKATYDKLMSDSAVAYIMKEKDKDLDIIRTIQEALIKKKYLTGKATGYCGTDTVAAIKAFQRDNNLKVDGQAGTETLRLLLGY